MAELVAHATHGRVGSTLDTAVCGGVAYDTRWSPVRGWHPARETIRYQLEFTLLPVNRDMFSCLHHTSNNIYTS